MKRVLFICVGNSCRSQIAEGYGNHFGSETVICDSAGVAHSGVVHPTAIQVMAEDGIDISRHRSKGIDAMNLEEYDAIISVCSVDTDSVCPAGFMGVTERWDIPDPVYGDLDAFRRVRDMLKPKVKALIERLAS